MKYEYKAIQNSTFLKHSYLNELGEEGWELITHAYNPDTCDHFYTFKREKVSPQDIPAICEYSGLRPVEGYKEEEIDKILNNIEGETDEERAYRRGYMDGYDEGLYDGQYK